MLRRFLSRMTKHWKTLIALVLVFTLIWGALQWVVVQGYSLAWTGFGDYTTPNGEFVRGKTLWDWMELFIIPIFLAIGAFYLNRSERNIERQRSEERATLEREISTDRQQESALQAYLDRMTDLLVKEKLKETKKEELRDVARIRTLTILKSLDKSRKGLVLIFLREAGLITVPDPIVILGGADLSGVILRDSNLNEANLSDANLRGADLTGAYLGGANLNGTDLREASLGDAVLIDATLRLARLDNSFLADASLNNADLSAASLQNADLSVTNLSNADLTFSHFSGSDLRFANLSDADLRHAHLEDANLSEAQVTNEQLATAESLEGAIMPDGTKHE